MSIVDHRRERYRMYDAIATVFEEFPKGDLQLAAISLGAITAMMRGTNLHITLEDGYRFACYFFRDSTSQQMRML